MGQKYCDKCEVAVDHAVGVCPACGHKEFVPGTVIWKRGTPKPNSPKVSTSTTPHLVANVPVTNKPNKMDSAPPAPPRPIPSINGEFSKTGKTIDDLIRAQNRTTHAVRAFVRFLFIQLTGITCAIFIWNVSIAIDGNTAIEFLAAVVWIGAVVWSSYAGWDELNKSNVD
jgi:hypothetical protein